MAAPPHGRILQLAVLKPHLICPAQYLSLRVVPPLPQDAEHGIQSVQPSSNFPPAGSMKHCERIGGHLDMCYELMRVVLDRMMFRCSDVR